ncbi:hypothetical protein G7085_13285 [Tessaracoccus sp. HDW20]|uniref:hypothetical protein n=1 Tax=Tessaracoccus coleopterorum TaxID=2714950 RepID=UPI0018D350A4|nr:hypothetical protein [Tessaracoccus coleopterorum]NHB85279.1 hypothetical protein [Tessaracoccus coleopterorum]
MADGGLRRPGGGGDPEALTPEQRADLADLLGSTWWRALYQGEGDAEDPEELLRRALPPRSGPRTGSHRAVSCWPCTCATSSTTPGRWPGTTTS